MATGAGRQEEKESKGRGERRGEKRQGRGVYAICGV